MLRLQTRAAQYDKSSNIKSLTLRPRDCTVYAYQYHIDNYTGLRFVSERLTLLQYWEFRELETYVEKIRELELTEKIERLTRLYSDDEFDDIYPDTETLFLDFISRGISVPEALKMVKVIRCGRSDKLTDHMNELLVQAGYSGEIIQRIKAIRYLKSKSNAIIIVRTGGCILWKILTYYNC